MTGSTTGTDRSRIVPWMAAICCVQLCLLLAAAFSPGGRVWGLNVWAYFPNAASVSLFLSGCILCVAVPFLTRRLQPTSESPGRGSSYPYFVAVLILTMTAAFCLLRTKWHFLGDGYQLLSHLASDSLLTKPNAFGTTLTLQGIKTLVGGPPESAALLSHRILSVASGVALLLAVAWLSARLLEKNVERVLLLLGVSSAGFMLLFFGYVENYAPFAATVAVYTMAGTLAAERRISRWWPLALAGVSIWWHVFGVALLPSAAYLLTAESGLGRWTAQRSRMSKVLLIGAAAGILAGAFVWLVHWNWQYRLTVLPLTSDRFTLDGYTLLSRDHLSDLLNLILLLLPGLPVLLAALFATRGHTTASPPGRAFLLVTCISCFAVPILVDPKLGMPRDWDLFAFVGIPLTVLLYYTVLRSGGSNRVRYTACALAVALGCVTLIPRAVSLGSERASISHFVDYLKLDPARGRNSWVLLSNHFYSRGDTAAADSVTRLWHERFPEEQLMADALDADRVEGDSESFIHMTEAIIESYPCYPNAYNHLGAHYVGIGQCDTAAALLEIAEGFRPFWSNVLTNLAEAYYCLGDYRRAEAEYRKAAALDATCWEPVYGMARLHRERGEHEEYIAWLEKAVGIDGVDIGVVRELLEVCLYSSKYAQAAQIVRTDARLRADTAYVNRFALRYPRFGAMLSEP